MRLILASQSPRRQALLRRITEDFTVVLPQIQERADPSWLPRELPEKLAAIKAAAVAQAYPDAVVIGADTVVVLDEQVLGKPEDREDACRMLRSLSGATHQVYTGVALRRGKEELTFTQCTQVTFYPLEERQIQDYVASGEAFDKAGAYGIQGFGSLFVKEIHGDYFNVVGFPIARIARELDRFCGKNGIKRE